MSESRVISIDSLKGLGILSVILGHIASPFSGFIYLWHMPLFFMIGGFFIHPNTPFLAFVKTNIIKIMPVYFVFGVIGIIIEYLKDHLLNRPFDVISQIIGLVFYMDYSHLQDSYALILWFLPSLLFAKIWAFLFVKFTRFLIIPYCVAIIVILAFDVNLPFVLDIGIVCSIFTITGYFLFNLHKNNNIFFPLMGGGISIFCYLFLNYDLFTYRNFIWVNHIFFTISFCVFLYLLFRIPLALALWTKIPFLAYFGRYSMFFYILHIYTNNIANALLLGFGIHNWILIFVISLVILIALKTIKDYIYSLFPNNFFTKLCI